MDWNITSGNRNQFKWPRHSNMNVFAIIIIIITVVVIIIIIIIIINIIIIIIIIIIIGWHFKQWKMKMSREK